MKELERLGQDVYRCRIAIERFSTDIFLTALTNFHYPVNNKMATKFFDEKRNLIETRITEGKALVDAFLSSSETGLNSDNELLKIKYSSGI